MPHTLSKAERLNQKKVIGRMFRSGSRSFTVFPLRIVYMDATDDLRAPVAMMTSVSKRHFKHAVRRNRVKRQIREAYRLNKACIANETNAAMPQSVMIAFIWLDKKLWPSHDVAKRVRNLMQRISEKAYGC